MMSEVKFVNFDKFLYIKLQDNDDLEKLFNDSIEKLNIKDKFKYQPSFYKNGDFCHIFLKEYENEKIDFLYPKPLIFENLANQNLIKEKNYAVLIFEDNNTFLCFFKNKKFIYLKQLIKFDLKSIKENENKEKLFFEILHEKGRVLELLKHYESQILILVDDKYDFLSFVKKYFKCQNLDLLINLNKLASFSPKYLNYNANFIKEKSKKIYFLYKLLIIFLAVFIISILFLCVISYKNMNDIKSNNENIDFQVIKLNEYEKNLKEKLQNLIKINNEKEKDIKAKEKLNDILKEQNISKIQILNDLILILNKQNLLITNLSIINNDINISFYDDLKNGNIFNNSKFQLLEQNQNTIKLKYKNE